ncbi:DUF4124 domain-containing protein [Massilia cavernae]|uniref:DUF4124 domain-containing protein n=1 Tax=Massilia cavernae TaxID=2320864 RepID=A0A418Y7R3_9BURK|nr:DUF4124 domain-containing protein [Massilia cavernae]RJG27035.1 DUF4124 domain-containing protein [Massilia cavernae]
MTTRIFPAVIGFALMSAAPFAAADIYLCTDAQGRRELTDASRPGCKMLDVPGSIAAPPARKGPAQQPARIASTMSTATPADFPRVDSAQQRARDDDRRGILSEELRSEERRLAELRKEFNNGEPERQGNEKNYAKYQARVADMRDSISRSEQNVAALKRELSNIR